MNWLRRIFGRRKIYGDLSEEIRVHLDEKVEELVAGGMKRKEAEYAARCAFGNVLLTEERSREPWRWPRLEDVLVDIRYALRMLRKSPGFTVVAILTLALGIGANTAVFSLLDALVLRPLPVPHPGQLVSFGVHNPSSFDTSSLWVSLPMFREISRNQKAFSSAFVWSSGAVMNVEMNRQLSLQDIWTVAGNFYSELGATPEIGRLIGLGDVNFRTYAPIPVATITYGLWQRYYGGTRDVVGKTLRIEGVPFTIIGVTRKGFSGISPGLGQAVTVPLTALPRIAADPDPRKHFERGDDIFLHADGRLRPGVTLAQARAQLKSMWPAVQEAIRPTRQTTEERTNFDALRFRVESGVHGESIVETRFAHPVYILLMISGLVLLVACVNLASLMLSRAASRSHEMGVRVALGAGRLRLTRQMLAESLLLSTAGALGGLGLAYWASHRLAAFILSRPTALRLSPDSRILGFAVATAFLTGVLFGLAPAWRASGADPSLVLQQGAPTLGRGTSRLGGRLVVAQVALSLVLAAFAGLFLRTLEKLHEATPGFYTRKMLDMRLIPRPGGYKNLDMLSYDRELTERVDSLPGVESAALGHLSIGTGYDWTESVRRAGTNAAALGIDFGMVMPGFLHTTGIRLLRGRTFTWQDDAGSPRVALASAALVKLLFPRGNAIGQRVEVTSAPKFKPVEIVGIVSDATLYDIWKSNPPTLYVPAAQYDRMGWPFLYVRTSGPSHAAAQAVRAAVATLNHEYVPSDMLWTIHDVIGRSLLRQRLVAMLSGFFGGLALLLAGIGLYGLMAYRVAGRAHEIGLRVALGAQRGTIARMLLREAAMLVGLGLAIGILCALAATRLVAHMLYGIPPYDPFSLCGAAGVLLAAGALAASIPARGAMRVDPVTALRNE